MSPRLLRFLTIIGIIYASLFGGVVEQNAVMRIAHQVGITALLAGWLLLLWRERRPFPSTPLDWPLLALGTAWTIAAIFSRHPRISLEYAWLIWMVILVFYLVVDLMRRGSRWQRWITEGLFMAGAMFVILAAAEMIMWYFGLGILPHFAQGWPSLFGLTMPPVVHEAAMPLGYNNPTGAYCLLIIPLALAGAATIPQRDLRWALGGLALGLVGVVLATHSRGASMGLGALAGMVTLAWLLRPSTRQRFPAVLRPLLAPRLLIAGALVAAVIGAALIFAMVIRARDANSISRLDLWVSAIEIVADDPLTGTGPRLFGGERLWHPHWARSHTYMPLHHAHSLFFHWLAEGGGVVLLPTLLLLDQLRRAWWREWKNGSVARRRRLEGAAIALAAYATHSLVDTFLQVQLITPVLIIGAYIIAGDQSHAVEPAARLQTPRRLRLVWLVLALLALAQIAFVPLHRGLWAHRRALAYQDAGDHVQALAAARQAQESDPWNDLYRLQEAIILGELAATEPQTYLDDAIAAFEDSVKRSATWDLGWHNLAALYAQAGRLEDAIAAEQQAIGWNQVNSGYFLKLGEYYTAAGRPAEARAAFFSALEAGRWLASSPFWTDPAYPERAAILRDAVAHFAPINPETALDIAIYGGLTDSALYLARVRQADGSLPGGLRPRLDALWPDNDPSAPPCWRCYDPLLRAPNPVAGSYAAQAEWLLSRNTPPDGTLTAEKAARAAIFLSENRSAWSWYVLARTAEQAGEEAATVKDRLARGLDYPSDFRSTYDTTVFTLHADLAVLPQARTPLTSWQSYEPWLHLAGLHESEGDWQAAREIFERVLRDDPYAWDVRAQLDGLSVAHP